MKSALLFSVLLLAACGPSELPASPPSVTRNDAIIGGTVAMGDPAVVALAVRYGSFYESLCTGTLIGPRTVLTAAHCIYAYGQNMQYYVTFGTESTAPTKVVQVAQQYKNPAYNQSANDFGVLRLASPVADVTPIAMNDAPLTQAHVGLPIRHVGFGLTVANTQQSGTKYEVTYNVRQVAQFTMESGASGKQTCQGDSGGPAFMTLPGQTKEKLVGVVSYGDQNCAYEGWDGRVDVGVPWIRATMAGWEQPTCETDGACVMGCTPVDQDCLCVADGQCSAECLDAALDPDCPRDCAANGVCAVQVCGRPDPDCIGDGFLCDLATQCQGRLCANDPQHPRAYCTRTCQTDTDCQAQMECSLGTCREKQKPVRALGETCTPGADFCVGDATLCTGPASGDFARCVKGCQSSADCPSGAVCEAGKDSSRYCRASALSFKNLTLPAVPESPGAAASGCSSTSLLGAWLAVGLLVRRRRSLSL